MASRSKVEIVVYDHSSAKIVIGVSCYNCFGQVVTTLQLSTDCVTASSVNMFKNKVDTYIRRAGYK